MVVAEIMTENPACIEIQAPLSQALELLDTLQVRHLPVVDDGELVGILSDRDLAAYRRSAGIESALPGIAAVMSSNVLSVEPEAEVSEAIDLLLEGNCGAVPVVEAGTDRLVGILSYVDILESHSNLLDG